MKKFLLFLALWGSLCLKAQSEEVIRESYPVFSQSNSGSNETLFLNYSLPKKVFFISIPFVITTTKLYKKADAAPRKPIKTTTTVTIKNEVLIEGKLFSDPLATFNLNFKNLGTGGKSFDLVVGFDGEGKGILTSFNGTQESATSDIIKGTAGILTSALNAVAGVVGYGFAGAATDDEIEVKEEQIVTEKGVVILGSDDNSKEVELSIKLNSAVEGQIPTVLIVFNRVNTIKENAVTKTLENKDKVESGIIYRIPAEFLVTATLKNNGLNINQTIVNDIVYVPQCGNFAIAPIPLKKGKRTLEILFSSTTGNLSKYSLKKESSLKASMSEVKTTVNDLSASISKMQDAQNFKKTNTIQSEIDNLKLQNEKLELQIKQKELQDN